MFKSHFNNKLQLQITERKYFNSVKLKPTSRLALLILINHLNCETGLMYPSWKTLAACCGCNEQQAGRALEELLKKNIIDVIPPEASGKNFNQYVLTEDFLHYLFDEETLSKWLKTTIKMIVEHEEHDINNKNLKNLKNSGVSNPLRKEPKLPKYYHNTAKDGINYPKYVPLKKEGIPMPANFKQMILKAQKQCG